MSVDCDCNGRPAAPQLQDMGILASTDPVALDKACLDLVFNHESTAGDNASPLINRINSMHGTHIVEYGEEIGLGTLEYTLVSIDNPEGEEGTTGLGDLADGRRILYNVFTLDGKKVLDRSTSLDSLDPGIYIVNGKKRVIN